MGKIHVALSQTELQRNLRNLGGAIKTSGGYPAWKKKTGSKSAARRSTKGRRMLRSLSIDSFIRKPSPTLKSRRGKNRKAGTLSAKTGTKDWFLSKAMLTIRSRGREKATRRSTDVLVGKKSHGTFRKATRNPWGKKSALTQTTQGNLARSGGGAAPRPHSTMVVVLELWWIGGAEGLAAFCFLEAVDAALIPLLSGRALASVRGCA